MITNHDVHVNDAEEMSVRSKFYPPHPERREPFVSIHLNWAATHRTTLYLESIEQAEAFSAMVVAAIAKLRKDQDAIALQPVK